MTAPREGPEHYLARLKQKWATDRQAVNVAETHELLHWATEAFEQTGKMETMEDIATHLEAGHVIAELHKHLGLLRFKQGLSAEATPSTRPPGTPEGGRGWFTRWRSAWYKWLCTVGRSIGGR